MIGHPFRIRIEFRHQLGSGDLSSHELFPRGGRVVRVFVQSVSQTLRGFVADISIQIEFGHLALQKRNSVARQHESGIDISYYMF